MIYLIIAYTNPYSIASVAAAPSAIVILSIWVIGLLLSITGGIMCLTGYSAPVQYPVYGQQYQPYGQPQQPYNQPYGQPQQPYGQPPDQPPQRPDNTNNQ